MINDRTKCDRCHNKSYTFCKDCDGVNNFSPVCTYEEYKKQRKEKSRSGKTKKSDARSK